MIDSVTVYNHIVDFLASLPNMQESQGQRALLARAGLQQQEQGHITFGGSPIHFFQVLVSTLNTWGRLDDGRHPLEALLEAAQDWVGANRRAYCDTLLHELRQINTAGAAQHSAPNDVPVNQYEKLLSWLNKLVEAEFTILLNSLLSVEQRNVLSQPVNRANFLGDMQQWEQLDEVERYIVRKYPQRFLTYREVNNAVSSMPR